jgi:hypothetical protein
VIPSAEVDVVYSRMQQIEQGEAALRRRIRASAASH